MANILVVFLICALSMKEAIGAPANVEFGDIQNSEINVFPYYYEINHCTDQPCEYGICHNLINGYVCECNPGFTGKDCEVDINECYPLPTPCDFGVCRNFDGGYQCVCDLYYTGEHCDVRYTTTSESTTSAVTTSATTKSATTTSETSTSGDNGPDDTTTGETTTSATTTSATTTNETSTSGDNGPDDTTTNATTTIATTTSATTTNATTTDDTTTNATTTIATTTSATTTNATTTGETCQNHFLHVVEEVGCLRLSHVTFLHHRNENLYDYFKRACSHFKSNLFSLKKTHNRNKLKEYIRLDESIDVYFIVDLRKTEESSEWNWGNGEKFTDEFNIKHPQHNPDGDCGMMALNASNVLDFMIASCSLEDDEAHGICESDILEN